jgi:VWFA-related protein
MKLFLPLLWLALPALAQQAAPDRRVELDVAVTDKAGKSVPGLQQQDFTVLDNKHPQKLVAFDAVAESGPPVEIVLLVDRVNISFINAAATRIQIDRFLRQNGGQLAQPISMVFFSDAGVKQLDASRDGTALAAALDASDSALRTVTRSQGAEGALERLEMSMQALGMLTAAEQKKPGRKMLIWLSSGWPMFVRADENMTAATRDKIFRQIVTAANELRQARMALYSVDPLGVQDSGGNPDYYREFIKGASGPKQVRMGDLALPVLAWQSGGRVLHAGNDIPRLIASCVADLQNYYVLSFEIAAPDGPDEYHALDVKVGKPGLTARTRTGYYAEP